MSGAQSRLIPANTTLLQPGARYFTIKDMDIALARAQQSVTQLQHQTNTQQAANITTLQSQVATLQSQMATANANIATLQSQTASLQTQINTINSRLAAAGIP